MSDTKFSCPACGQHLAGDARYAGTQIRCPACQQPFIVPAARAPVPVAVAVSSGGTTLQATVPGRAVSPPPPPAASQPVSSPARTSRLAIASLICSIGSFIIIPLGFIPGIICGHMAKKRIAQDPTLAGRGLAKTGLIVGYVALGIQGLVLLAVLSLVLFFGVRVAQQVPAPPGQAPPMARVQRPRPLAVSGVLPEPAAESGPADTTPDAAGWTLQLKDVSIPAGPVTGRIKGRIFNSEKAWLENGWLKFSQGAGFFPDLEIDVVLFINETAELSGKTFTVPKAEVGGNPHVWLKWKPAGRDVPEHKSWMQGYALDLEFGVIADGKVPGKIYLCVPDAEKSFVRGTFKASLKPRVGPQESTPERAATTRPKRN